MLAAVFARSQELKVVNRISDYRRAVAADSLLRMVELKSVIPAASYDLRYATANNFTGKKLYKKGNKTYLRLAAAKALRDAANDLAQSGYRFKIWDAYRPYAATKKMWDLVRDERYVANPAKGSGHNRGLAVDLTLVKDGKDVEMGTGFDNFTDSAHHDFPALPEPVLQNRRLLRTTLERHGFRTLDTEWWHYSFPNDGRYDVLDLPPRKLGH